MGLSLLSFGVLLGGLSVGLPPPLCRGRVVGPYEPGRDEDPSARAIAEVQIAYEALCPGDRCGTGRIVKNATIGNNAATWVSGIRDGAQTHAKIVYSAQFLDALNVSFGPGASFGVLAHEVGHHLTAALSLRHRFESSWNEELRADYLAGCALGRTGTPPDSMENALRALASVATRSHPSFNQRNPAVRKGYRDCVSGADGFARARRVFGLQSAFRSGVRPNGCFGYWYRLTQEINRVGPVASPRRRAGPYRTEARCTRARKKTVGAGLRQAEACRCE